MATAQDIVDHIKSDLILNGTDYDTQLLNAIHSALRQYRGKRYWFLKAYGTISVTSGNYSVALPDDYAAPESFDLVYGSQILAAGRGFDLLMFDNLKFKYWLTNPLETTVPKACAILGDTLYLSCLADNDYTINITYYKKDEELPALSETSIWFDDGYDVIRSTAQYFFKRDSQMLEQADRDMMMDAIKRLDDAHCARIVGF